MNEMTFPIEAYLGEIFTWQFKKGEDTSIRLVDGEIKFNQPGISCGFIHFEHPDIPGRCLGFGGVTTVYNKLKNLKESEDE